MVLGSALGPMTLSNHRFLAPLIVSGRNNYRVDLWSSHVVVSYSHNICATIAPVGLSCWGTFNLQGSGLDEIETFLLWLYSTSQRSEC